MKRRGRALRFALLLGVFFAGCASRTDTTTTTEVRVVASTGTENNANRPPAPDRPAGTMRVAFRDVVAPSGCFYFSGPLDHGRDDHLGEVAMFDGQVLRFPPALDFIVQPGGTELVLVRDSPHEYSGTWRVRETITLVPSGAGFVGRYHYDEFDPGSPSPGTCHIDARIELWP